MGFPWRAPGSTGYCCASVLTESRFLCTALCFQQLHTACIIMNNMQSVITSQHANNVDSTALAQMKDWQNGNFVPCCFFGSFINKNVLHLYGKMWILRVNLFKNNKLQLHVKHSIVMRNQVVYTAKTEF